MTGQLFALTSLMSSLGLWAFELAGSSSTTIVVILTIIYASGLFLKFRKEVQIPSKSWNFIAFLVLILFAADYLVISNDMILAGSRLIAVLFGLKLFDLRKSSDYLLAYALAFFQILAAAAATVSMAFFLMLAIYVLGAIWAMILLNVLRDMKLDARGVSAPAGLFGPRFFAVVAVLTAVSLVVTLALFFFLPRIGVGIFQRKALNPLKVIGFSDTVDLGALGLLKEDSTIVMRAEFPAGKPQGTIYFKGATLDYYDGKKWSRERESSFIKRAGPEGFHLGSGPGKWTEFSVLLEPLDTEVLFTIPNVFRLEGNFPAIWVERSGVLRLPSPPFSRIEYKAWTDLSRIDLSDVPRNGPQDAYLSSAPEGQRVQALANSIAWQGTALEKATAIEKYLKANYIYTLSPKSKEGAGPLEDFLFHSREGYCEHFATSMVMLLRASGVPARIVTGFLEGEWNGLGNYFIVRQQDAHSWVEAYIENAGWMRFDPTPMALVPPYNPSAISLYVDLMTLKWNRYIIQFSFADQMRMAFSVEEKTLDIFDGLRSIFEKRSPYLKGMSPYAIGVASVLLAILIMRRAFHKSSYQKGPGFYGEMLRALARKGLKKRPDETPLEFAMRVNDRRVIEITEAFQTARYGGVKAGPAETERIKKAVKELKKG